MHQIKAKLAAQAFDAELQGYVENIKQYREDVPALCGSPWVEWRSPSSCQVCQEPVDCKEKGLHCQMGGHRICWGCMVKKINWVEVQTLMARTSSH